MEDDGHPGSGEYHQDPGQVERRGEAEGVGEQAAGEGARRAAAEEDDRCAPVTRPGSSRGASR
ncbi:hypothetical protein CLM85_31990 [Streptomyces albidoflavus]|nr:hypothetical protein CLM81_24395 [Streptomyces albidoflavus]PAX91898.1 hypothetical protein CLM82_06625 [Streptomyces albidoflavus]PBO20032.1 hypothetical protein CLM83_02965 [Streptomyces albidoflavus]PBO20820.1 hypothetical protein CLM85_31990 [Streptomyces albidoflavus]PBO31256.1 hypothetical protein CLM84_03590 [Streptomyces albidoflavus]